MEVMRFATHSKRSNRGEGRGWYGCWAFPATGSGIWLNSNATIVLPHKDEALGKPPFGRAGGQTDLLGQLLERERVSATHVRPLVLSNHFHDARRAGLWLPKDAAFVNEEFHRDGLIPFLAHQLGLGTVQVQFPWPELIITTDSCMHPKCEIQTCLPVDLRLGWRASEPCECSERLLGLNCDASSSNGTSPVSDPERLM